MGALHHLWHAAISRLDWYWTGHVDWMAFNFLLALLPVLLAIALFGKRVKPTIAWFVGLGLFLLVLPYAPYVLTDVIHFNEAVDSAMTRRRGVVEFAPLYLLYLAGGFIAYVFCVRRCTRSISDLTRNRRAALIAFWGLHVVAVLGIYVGRVTRLHAWNIFTDTAASVEGLATMVDARLLVIVPATIVLGVLTRSAEQLYERTTRIVRNATLAIILAIKELSLSSAD